MGGGHACARGRPRLRARAHASPRMQAPAVAEVAGEHVCTVSVALLGQQSKIEDMLKGGDLSNEVDFAGFTRLVDQLEVQATEPDKQAIFSMIDTEGSGTIDVGGLKRALRSSGAIQRMYDDSIKTFGLLLAATLAFDAGVWLLHGGAAAFDFLAAYVVEDSLSVDNLFVFLLIFRYYKVRAARSPPPPSRPPSPPRRPPSHHHAPSCRCRRSWWTPASTTASAAPSCCAASSSSPGSPRPAPSRRCCSASPSSSSSRPTSSSPAAARRRTARRRCPSW